MEYRIIEGKKLGSHNYECGGFLYNRSSSTQQSAYLRCTLWRTREIECPGFGKISLENNLFYLNKNHCHSEEAYQSDIITLNNKIKRAAETTTENLRAVFDNVTSKDEAGASITYQRVRNTMLKRRRVEIPGNPKTPQEFEKMLVQTRFVSNFRGMVTIPEGFAAIFASDLMLTTLKRTKNINFDGTFHVVPKLFYQLFTIFIQEGHHALPAVHVLMSQKNESLYLAVLRKIVEIVPFYPELAIGDYERAPRNALRAIFPNLNVSGCLFHYSKAIWKKVNKLDLCSSYKRNSNLNNWIRLMMSLPLLPQDDILPVFQTLVGDTFSLDLKPTEENPLIQLITYMKKEWIKRNDLSVYHAIQKINNCCESYHKELKSIIRIKRPNIWSFMESLEKILIKYDLEYTRLLNGLEIGERRKKDIEKEKQRDVCKQRLQNKEYTPIEFIQKISYTVGCNINLNDCVEYSDSEESDEMTEKYEEPLTNPCVICLQKRNSTFVFFPCGHAQICEKCEINFNSRDRCPTCRSFIANKLQIFQ